MAQDGTTAGGSSYTIDNVTFPVGRTKLQSIFDAIRSTNIGNTAPDLVAGQFWIDNNTPSTTVWTLYLYDGTDNISFATIDTINNTVNFLDSTFDLINDTTPQLGGNLDLNSNDITGTGNINITGTIQSSGNITGTLATASQPNITSVGTLTSFASTGIDDNATSTAITINSSEQVAFTDGTASLPSITNLGDENTGIFFPLADTIAFSEGGVEAMRIDSNGQLNTGKVVVRKDGASEIGQLVILNQSPDSNADLHFKGYAYRDRARIRAVDNASSTTGGSMKIETAGGTSTDGSSLETRMLLDKNGNISFYEDTGTTPKMFWDATNERFGIGTTSPESTLHVVGTNQLFSPLRIQPQSTNGTSAFSIRQDATQDRLTLGLSHSSASAIIGHRVKPSNVTESDAAGFLSSSSSNTARTAIKFNIDGAIQFYNAPQQATAVNSVVAMTERMRITSSGNVGIGATSITPRDSGARVLELYGGTNGRSSIKMNNSTSGTGATDGLFMGYDSGFSFNILNNEAGIISFGTSNTERMRITSAGNVGIGTSSPSQQLHVEGSGTTAAIIKSTGSSTAAAVGI
jgi:hypothetical protein